jgi:hypothetical protein
MCLSRARASKRTGTTVRDQTVTQVEGSKKAVVGRAVF